MISPTLAHAYRRARRPDWPNSTPEPFPPVPARDALRMARYALAPIRHEWTEDQHGRLTTTEKRGPVTLRVTIEPDYYAEAEPHGTFTDSPTWRDGAAYVRNPLCDRDCYLAGDGWSRYHNRNHAGHWYRPTDETLAELRADYRHKMARGPADLAALSHVRAWALDDRRTDREAYAITATAWVDGIELASDSIGGYEVDPSTHPERIAEDMLTDIDLDDLAQRARDAAAEMAARLIRR